MNVFKEYHSSSPDLSDDCSSTGPNSRYTRAMNYYEHVKKLHLLSCSPSPDSQSDLSQELRQLGLCLHSRSGSKDSLTSGKNSFSLKDISNSREFARAHRRTSSKLLNFEESSEENTYGYANYKGKSSVLRRSSGQNSSHLLGTIPKVDLQDSKEGSLALISEFPSSLCEDNGKTLGSESSRSAPLAIDIDLRSPAEGRETSTIVSNLSSDSSRMHADWECDRSAVAYVSAADVPIREQLEINLYDHPSMEFRSSASVSRMGKKLFCNFCQKEVVPIMSFQPSDLSWWQRLLHVGQFIRCCHEARLGQEDVVQSCRRCGAELRRSNARRPALES